MPSPALPIPAPSSLPLSSLSIPLPRLCEPYPTDLDVLTHPLTSEFRAIPNTMGELLRNDYTKLITFQPSAGPFRRHIINYGVLTDGSQREVFTLAHNLDGDRTLHPAGVVFHLCVASASVRHRPPAHYLVLARAISSSTSARRPHSLVPPGRASLFSLPPPTSDPLLGLYGLVRVDTGGPDEPCQHVVRISESLTTSSSSSGRSTTTYLAIVGIPTTELSTTSRHPPLVPSSSRAVELSRDEVLIATALWAATIHQHIPRPHDLAWLGLVAVHPAILPETIRVSQAIEVFGRSLPYDPINLLRAGLVVHSREIPTRLEESYRETLDLVARPASHGCPGSLTVLLLFDAIVRTRPPVDTGSTNSAHIQRRLRRFQQCEFHILWDSIVRRNHFMFVDMQPDSERWSLQSRASRAQFTLHVKRSVAKAAKQLRAPNLKAKPPDNPTELIQSLNPQPGDVFHDSFGHVCGTRHAFPSAEVAYSTPRAHVSPPRTTSVRFSAEHFCHAVRRLDTASAQGADGLDNFAIRLWLAQVDPLSRNLAAVFNTILCGDVPPHFREMLVTSRLILIPKSDGESFRPIAIGSCLLRFLCSTALRSVSDKVANTFDEYQFGVGVPSGVEQVHHIASMILAENPDYVLVSADSANAFGSFDRRAIIGPTIDSFPELFHLIDLIYLSKPSAQLYETRSSPDACPEVRCCPSSVGSRQGCVFGSFLFSLALQPLLEDNPFTVPMPGMVSESTCLCLAYADDISFIGSPENTAKAFAWHAENYTQRLQGRLRLTKSHVLCPHHVADTSPVTFALQEAGIPDNTIPLHTDGALLVGSPLGTPAYLARVVRQALQAIHEELTALTHMPSLQARHSILRFATTQLLTHLMRTVPILDPSLNLDPHITSLDEHLRHVVSTYSSCTEPPRLDDVGWVIAQLPAAKGGLGIPSFHSRCDPALLSALHASSSLWQQRFDRHNSERLLPSTSDLIRLDPVHPNPIPPPPPNHPQPLNLVNCTRRAIPRIRSLLPASVPLPTPGDSKYQRAIMNAVADSARVAHILSNPHIEPKRKAVHVSAAGDPYLFSSCPFSFHSRLENNQWLVVTARRLLQPIPDLVAAPACSSCSGLLESAREKDDPTAALQQMAFGDFVLCCHQHHRTTFWHNPIRNHLHHILRAAFEPDEPSHSDKVRMEHDVYEAGSQRRDCLIKRPDVTIFGVPGLPPHSIDVVTATAARASTSHNNCISAGVPSKTAEALKKDQWRNTMPLLRAARPPHTFVPFAVEEGGRLGNEAMNFLKRASQHIQPTPGSSRDPPGLTHWLRSLALANARCIANCILSHIDTSNAATSARLRPSLKPAPHNTHAYPAPHPPASLPLVLANDPSTIDQTPCAPAAPLHHLRIPQAQDPGSPRPERRRRRRSGALVVGPTPTDDHLLTSSASHHVGVRDDDEEWPADTSAPG